MAATLADCPHCGGEKVGFTFLTQHQMVPAVLGFITALMCNKCQSGIFRVYRLTGLANYRSPMDCPADPGDFGFVLQDEYPRALPLRAPQHVPEQLSRFFIQASDSFRRGNFDASALMSRKVVDVSSQQMLGTDAKKHGNIKGRIDALAAKGLITSDLAEWAHQVRLGGAEAAHEEEAYEGPDAEELLDFAELYLTYAYTLPRRLEERKARAAAEKAANV